MKIRKEVRYKITMTPPELMCTRAALQNTLNTNKELTDVDIRLMTETLEQLRFENE